MEIRIDDRKARIFPNHLPIIQNGNTGLEGIVYNYNGKALKLYHRFPRKKILNLKVARELKKVEANRILGIEEIVTDKKRNLIGQTSELITDLVTDPIECLASLPTENLIEECHLLKQDCATYTDHHIELDDLLISNLVLTIQGELFLIDQGSYRLSDKPTELIWKVNITHINELFERLITAILKNHYPTNCAKRTAMRKQLLEERKSSDIEYYGDYFQQILEPSYSNLGEYIKRMEKRNR